MTELEGQLRSYATATLGGVRPVTAEEILREQPRVRTGRRRTAAVVVLVGVLAASVTVWIATRPTGPTPGVTTGTSPASPPPTSWTRLSALQDANTIQAGASSGHRVVLAGSGIWFSSDAHTWSTALGSAAVGSLNPFTQAGGITAVISNGSGFVAAGQGVDPASGQAVAAIWTSPDGRHWNRVLDRALQPATPPIPAGDSTPTRGSIQAISRGGPGFVAVGGVFAGTFAGRTLVTPPDAPAVWVSRDATHWTRVDTGTAFGLPNGASPLTLTNVVADGRSLVLTAEQGAATFVFESRDAVHWHRTAVVSGTVAKLITYHRLLVAVGSRGGDFGAPQRAVIWSSPDAVHWQRVLTSAPTGLTTFDGVATTGHSLVAVGYRGTGEPVVDAIMATSPDAKTWRAVPGGGQPFASHVGLSGATAVGAQYLVFGTEITGGTGSGTSPFTQDTAVFESSSPGR
jgi:hypothetical protein